MFRDVDDGKSVDDPIIIGGSFCTFITVSLIILFLMLILFFQHSLSNQWSTLGFNGVNEQQCQRDVGIL